jgi:hypothetical protein
MVLLGDTGTCYCKLLTLPEHLSSPPDFIGDHIAQALVFCVVVYIIVCPFIFFFWPLYCLSVSE